MNARQAALGTARRIIRKIRPNRPWTMFDSVTVSEIPGSAEAVAGYVAGNWPTFPVLQRNFPHARRLSIAVQAWQAADCLDIEQGDAVVADAPAWFHRATVRGVVRPVLYTSLANAAGLVAVMTKNKIPRSSYRLWTAHYSGQPHVCNGRCGYGFTGMADATQWTDKFRGRNLDASLCVPNFFGGK